MYCRSRPQYRSDLGWILGVAFLGTLTRSARPAQGFTYVRCCSAPPASSPHDLAAPGRIVSRRPHLRAVAFGLRLLPTCSAEDLHLQSRVHAWHTNTVADRKCARDVGDRDELQGSQLALRTVGGSARQARARVTSPRNA